MEPSILLVQVGQIDRLPDSVVPEALSLELWVVSEELLGSLLSGRGRRLGPLVASLLSRGDMGRFSLVTPLHDAWKEREREKSWMDVMSFQVNV